MKTRLVPPLTAEEATTLSAAFLYDITATIASVGRNLPVAGFVAYAPAGGEALFDGKLAPQTGLVLADGSVPLPPGISGIGRSLVHAMRSLLGRGFDAVCLVNSDSPTLPAVILAQAVGALADGQRVVLGPAEDGGYYLIGVPATLARRAEALFRDIPWSTPSVTEATLARAAEVPLQVLSLPVWYDVDDAASLRRLAVELADRTGPAAGVAPHTAESIARLGLSRRLADPIR
ncbi:MAG TPA: TIGR04282 family arsenosugar biosynthesis glycosyltransferase [Rhodocyclaceae bacterium]|nr:TIGR04282 family arsenosugar biosynthesis glycosyltransferase [Rhodocyclaceae bacterium]